MKAAGLSGSSLFGEIPTVEPTRRFAVDSGSSWRHSALCKDLAGCGKVILVGKDVGVGSVIGECEGSFGNDEVELSAHRERMRCLPVLFFIIERGVVIMSSSAHQTMSSQRHCL